jgi:preprotein translocase subunit YajC
MILNAILAQTAGATPAVQDDPRAQMLKTLGMFGVMGVGLYFMLIRPQSKKAKQHAEMLKAMRPGDKVVTSGGVYAIVVSVKDKTVVIRSAETKLEVLKSAVTEITERAGEPAKAEAS